MPKTSRLTCLVLALTLVPALAYAQLPIYRVSNPAIGERYNVELTIGLWNPRPDITISSDSLAIIGTQIDAVNDLGFATSRFPDYQLVLRPARKHKIRFEYIPIKYSADTVLQRTITFRGVAYQVGVPVNSVLDWKAYRFGYEYDFVYRDRGFVGVIADLKYADVQASLTSPGASASAHERAPIPAIGGIARGYVAENVSLTGELTGFKLPESASRDLRGRYVDFDIYATVNFSDSFGVQGGYRSLDAMYQVTNNSGSLTLRGLYFRGVVRF
jgi:hypothetical protein